jgi:DNA polymerase-3 subunit beta
MKFTVERDALHAGLGVVMNQTKSRADIAILHHVLVEATGNGLRLTGHSMDSCAVVTVQAAFDVKGSAALPADRLHELVSGLPTGSHIGVEIEGDRATVRSGRATYRFGTLPGNEFPGALEPQDPISITLTAKQVAAALKTPAPSICEEQSRRYLGGIFLHKRGKEFAACATDGHTLMRVKPGLDVPDFPAVIVPQKSCAEIAKLADKDDEITLEIAETLLAVTAGNRRFVTKLVDGNVPDYERVIPPAVDEPIKIDAAQLDAALTRLFAACDPQARAAVKLSWTAGENKVHASLYSQFAEGAESIDAEIGDKRESGAIGFQPDYMRKLIDASGGEYVHLHIAGPGDPIRIENPNDSKFVAVLMPCRV